MLKHRILFTFGTLYEPTLISALLGYEPKNFLAILKDYGVYQGTQNDLSEEIKEDLKKRRDLTNFTFLFAHKTSPSLHYQMSGKAYYITTKDERIIDCWERCPKWYRKERVEIEDKDGNKIQAIVYVIDKEGRFLQKYTRVPYELASLIENATKIRKKLRE